VRESDDWDVVTLDSETVARSSLSTVAEAAPGSKVALVDKRN
jgi:hypothetical protein